MQALKICSEYKIQTTPETIKDFKKKIVVLLLFTFLTQPNFLVLFRTGSDNQPSNLDSGKTKTKHT